MNWLPKVKNCVTFILVSRKHLSQSLPPQVVEYEYNTQSLSIKWIGDWGNNLRVEKICILLF